MGSKVSIDLDGVMMDYAREVARPREAHLRVGNVVWNSKEGYEGYVEITQNWTPGRFGREWEVKDVIPGRPYKYWVQERLLSAANEMEVLAWAAK